MDSKTQWIKSDTELGAGESTITLLISGNPTNSTRVGYVYVYGEVQTYIIRVVQTSIDSSIDPDGSAIPICNEISIEVDADKVEYHIYDEDANRIYAGYAYRFPDDEGNMKIELNDVLSDYLKNHISFTEGLQEMDGFYKTFTITTTSGSSDIEVYNAWEQPKSPLLNEPISNEIDPRQYLFINYIDAYGNLSLYKNGSETDGLGSNGGGVYVVPRVDAICGEEV